MVTNAEEIGVTLPGPSFFDTEHLKTDLKGRSVRGATITLVAQGAKFALQLGSTMILARLLSPDDFGLIAMVTAITAFAMMFKDMGLSMATVQRPQINHAQVSTLFWINAGFGVLIAALLAAAAPGIAWFYHQPELTRVMWVLSATFIFGGLTVQHQALLRRNMRFFALGLIDVIAIAVSVAAAILGGLWGAGYWALVIMQIVLAVATATGVWIAMPWRPGRPSRHVGFRGMLGFGGNLAGFNLINYFARNLDNVLIGWYWGATALGLYSRAYSLLLFPIVQINAPISMVAIPALSRLQDEPDRFSAYYLRALSVIALVSMPLSVLVFLFADEVIFLLLGPEWMPAAKIFRFLAMSACLQPVCNTSGWLYLATGRSRELLRWGTLGVLWICASFVVGLPFGATAVALAYSCTVLLWAWPCMYLATRGTAVRILDVVGVVKRPALIALSAGALAHFVRLCVGRYAPAGSAVLWSITTFLAAYLLLERRSLGQVYAGIVANPFLGSKQYWIQRYRDGGNSGAGSYGQLAEFKAEILNDFVMAHDVKSVIEYGCGDGNQLSLAAYGTYIGYDISPEAVSMCRRMFHSDTSKRFCLMGEYGGEKADLTLSLDVIYHLVEQDTFEEYMRRLFASSSRFVVIYSSDFETPTQNRSPHIRHRKVTMWIENNIRSWVLIRHISNKHRYVEGTGNGSLADFYIYAREGDESVAEPAN